ncbi:hypothetical protein HDU98_002592 [Podochytrium sp. JEL0797]|nr:hypothetical protein HDU98_002592 [Podochytrium sp. JEL0797]
MVTVSMLVLSVVLSLVPVVVVVALFAMIGRTKEGAGDKVKAMKCLLRSNDVDRIIFFANVSGPKHKEIYVIAANFLQTLDWRSNASVMKAIITFYSKARAFKSLSAFYDSCCQVEIDEYQNYEKALGALKESAKCLSKAKDASQDALKSLVTRITYLESFVAARASNNPAEMVGVCEGLLRESGIDVSVAFFCSDAPFS